MSVSIDLVLAPVDSSDESEVAAEYALAVARQYDADVHLLHILDERLLDRLEEGAIEAATVAEQQRSFTGRIRERARDADGTAVRHSSALGFSSQTLSQTPGSVILDAADELDADFLVVPRVTPSSDPDEALGKAALYVLEYASQPVLSV